MKKYLLSLLFLCVTLFAAESRSTVLYNETAQPSTALLQVLDAFSLCHDGTWESIVKNTQEKWLRKPSSERWEIKGSEDQSPENTYALISKLGITETVLPTQKHYDYVAIHGATLARVKERYAFLESIWEKGVRFDAVILLTGDRTLAPEIENEKTMTDGKPFEGPLPTNEAEMMRFVYDRSPFPEDLRTVPVYMYPAPKKSNGSRPDTESTILAWQQSAPIQSGSVLFIGTQPFLGRADSLVRHLLSPQINVETVGPGFTVQFYKTYPGAKEILLDELARWLYQEQIAARDCLP